MYVSNILQVIKNDLSPKWRPFDVKMSRLCGGNPNTTIKVCFMTVLILTKFLLLLLYKYLLLIDSQHFFDCFRTSVIKYIIVLVACFLYRYADLHY